jgi:hypothetical protein
LRAHEIFAKKNNNFSDIVAIALLYIGFGSSFERGQKGVRTGSGEVKTK